MSLDTGTEFMLADAYHETFAEAIAQGNGIETAHREGLTAAGMFLAVLTGMEDAAARATVEALSNNWQH